MATVLLIIHVFLALSLIGVVLLQRSEGGALGIGGGGGGGGFMSGRGAANFLTRVTAGLAAAFFATSMVLSIVASGTQNPASILDTPPGTTAPAKGKAPKSGDSKLPAINLETDLPPAEEPPKSAAPAPAPPPRVPQSK